jgi:protein-tyrosine phosphatase
MSSRLYWLNGPWPGKLALAARPRGEDWLSAEIADWKRAGIHTVLSLLTPAEQQDLGLQDEAREVKAQGLVFSSFPIPDREVPNSEAKLSEALETVANTLWSGNNVVVHCRQGIGRTGLIASCLLIKSGMTPGAAMDAVSVARGVPVPETAEQRDWIDHYAPALTK